MTEAIEVEKTGLNGEQKLALIGVVVCTFFLGVIVSRMDVLPIFGRALGMCGPSTVAANTVGQPTSQTGAYSNTVPTSDRDPPPPNSGGTGPVDGGISGMTIPPEGGTIGFSVPANTDGYLVRVNVQPIPTVPTGGSNFPTGSNGGGAPAQPTGGTGGVTPTGTTGTVPPTGTAGVPVPPSR